MAFTNTVNTLGEAVLIDKIIDRSITEYYDDVVTSIGISAFRNCVNLTNVDLPEVINFGSNYAFEGCSLLESVNIPKATHFGTNCFYGCTALKSVNFPSAEIVGNYAFYHCENLQKADFGALTAIEANKSFGYCSNLTALILRNANGVCSLSSQSPFTGTPIDNTSGNGYIYVPAALVDSYKNNSKWSTYADKIRAIEDYPEVCDPYSWVAVFKNIDNGTYKDVYNVGDTVELDLGTEGTVNMQIAAFDTDDLADGSGKAPITWVSKELLNTIYAWNETSDKTTEWSDSKLRTYINETIIDFIPETVRNSIVDVIKITNTETSTEKVWIPSATELGITKYYGYITDANGYTYSDVFTNEDSLIKQLNGEKRIWWTRTLRPDNKTYVVCIGTSGSSTPNSKTFSFGVCIGFCT